MKISPPAVGSHWVERNAYRIEWVDGERQRVPCVWVVTSIRDKGESVYAKITWKPAIVSGERPRRWDLKPQYRTFNGTKVMIHPGWYDRFDPA